MLLKRVAGAARRLILPSRGQFTSFSPVPRPLLFSKLREVMLPRKISAHTFHKRRLVTTRLQLHISLTFSIFSKSSQTN